MAVDHGQSPVVHVPDLLDCQLQRLLLTPADQENGERWSWDLFAMPSSSGTASLRSVPTRWDLGISRASLNCLLIIWIFPSSSMIQMPVSMLLMMLWVMNFVLVALAQLVIGYFQKLHKLVDII